MQHDPGAQLIEAFLDDPHAAWSLGTFGAIAEFMRDPDEPVTGHATTRITDRGAISLDPTAGFQLFAHEKPSRDGQGWSQTIELCLPTDEAAMHRRTKLTELGPDQKALRKEDRNAILFDMGLDAYQVDVCIRSADPATIDILRSGVGRSLADPANPVMSQLPRLSPNRVFICRFGRIEIFQPIPPPDGKSPEGPHTHVLPQLLKSKRTHAATTAMPEGFVPCMQIYPLHPLKDMMGADKPFDRAAHEAFQSLLDRYGDPDVVAFKRTLEKTVGLGVSDDAGIVANSKAKRAAMRVALRQMMRSATASASSLAILRAKHDRATDEDSASEEA